MVSKNKTKEQKMRERLRSLGLRIKMARSESDLTQEDLAKLLGFKGQVAISRWERGKVALDIPTLYEISEITKKSMAYFFAQDEDMSYEKLKSAQNQFIEMMKNSMQITEKAKELGKKING